MSESIFTREGYIRPAVLVAAYRSGLFPMAVEHGEIAWFSPDPRGIIPLDGLHIPKGLKRALRKKPFEIRINTAFARVMEGCGARENTWISPEILLSYQKLNELGYAHSVECWDAEGLAGGLYGVAIGGAFFGESMFSRKTDASKVALVHLVERLNARGFSLLDTQWSTGHLATLGCIDIPRDDYMRRLNGALKLSVQFFP